MSLDALSHQHKVQPNLYFYAMPGLSPDKADLGLSSKRLWNGRATKHLIFDLEDIRDRTNMTFTVDDSFRSYRTKLLAQGFACRELTNRFAELADYGQVFPIDALDKVYLRNKDIPDLTFEIQVWDRDVLVDYLREHAPPGLAQLMEVKY